MRSCFKTLKLKTRSNQIPQKDEPSCSWGWGKDSIGGFDLFTLLLFCPLVVFPTVVRCFCFISWSIKEKCFIARWQCEVGLDFPSFFPLAAEWFIMDRVVARVLENMTVVEVSWLMAVPREEEGKWSGTIEG